MTIQITPRADRLQRLREQRDRLSAEIDQLERAEVETFEPPHTPTTYDDCGTETAYKRHLRNEEHADEVCLEAHRVHERSEYARRKLLEWADTAEFAERLAKYGKAS